MWQNRAEGGQMDRFKLGLNVVKGAKSEAKQDRKKAIYFLSQKHPPKSLGGLEGILDSSDL